MKSIQSINSGTFARVIAALLLGSAMLLPAGNAISADATVQTTGGISHASGGIGDESIAKLELNRPGF